MPLVSHDSREERLPSVPSIDYSFGMRAYATRSAPLPGRLSSDPGDFVVAEISLEGQKVTSNSRLQYSPTSSQWLRYGYYILTKKGIGTLTAVARVSRRLNIPQRRFTFAGLKDAKAATSQLVAIENPPVALEKFEDGIVQLKRVGFYYRSLEAGDHSGNSFEITLRDIPVQASAAGAIMEGFLSETERIGGIPAFYAYQRFGTKWAASHKIGKWILLGRLNSATTEMLHPGEAGYDTQDTRFSESAGGLHIGVYESRLLNHLRAHPDDYLGAFRKIPLTLRRLYVQAFQAYIFNCCLSARLAANLPLDSVLEGDVVIYGQRLRRGGKTVAVTPDNIKRIQIDLKSKRASLAIPVVGFATRLQRGVTRKTVERMLAEEGVSQEDFRCSAMPEARAHGTFRPALMKPGNLAYEVRQDIRNPVHSNVTLRFTLDPGFYATALLRELIKPSAPADAGF